MSIKEFSLAFLCRKNSMKLILPVYIKPIVKYEPPSCIFEEEIYLRGVTYSRISCNDSLMPSVCYLERQNILESIKTADIFLFRTKHEENEIKTLFSKTDDEILMILKSSMHKNTLFMKK